VISLCLQNHPPPKSTISLQRQSPFHDDHCRVALWTEVEVTRHVLAVPVFMNKVLETQREAIVEPCELKQKILFDRTRRITVLSSESDTIIPLKARNRVLYSSICGALVLPTCWEVVTGNSHAMSNFREHSTIWHFHASHSAFSCLGFAHVVRKAPVTSGLVSQTICESTSESIRRIDWTTGTGWLSPTKPWDPRPPGITSTDSTAQNYSRTHPIASKTAKYTKCLESPSPIMILPLII